MRFLIYLSFVALMVGCSMKPAIIDDYVEFQSDGWHYNNVCSFSGVVEDTTAYYNIEIIVRNDNSYPNQNLWVFVDHLKPDSTVVKDTFEFYLADDLGRWAGKGITLFDNVFVVKDSILMERGTHHLAIKQGMRDNFLPGIKAVGMKVEMQ